MTRATRRDMPTAQRRAVTQDDVEPPTPRIPPKPARSTMPLPAPELRPSGPAPGLEGEANERDRRLRGALQWDRFEAWCVTHGLPGPPDDGKSAVATVALYITHLAATGRGIVSVARALLRETKG